MRRRTTPAGELARLGFADAARAERLLSQDLALDPEGADAGLLASLAASADPDLALITLSRITLSGDLLTALRADAGLRSRLTAVLGASAALGDHLARHPGDWRVLSGPDALRSPGPAEVRADLLMAVGAKPDDPEPPSPPPRRTADPAAAPAASLAAAYRRRLLHLAARDLTGAVTVDETAAELADLAAAALEAALAIARSELPPGSAPARLAVIAMGKCGGRELNYASDVDVIFVAAPAGGPQPGAGSGGPGPAGAGSGGAEAAVLRTATWLAAGLVRTCSQTTAEGALFPVDPNLRPEGRDGPLVRTLASHVAYYQRWAKTWEFQALLKARPVAGDRELGQAYLDALSPMVWQAAQRPHFVADVQAMRRRVIGNLAPGEAARQLKLGPGGLRDIEFAVQLLQLVHGRTDDSLRETGTLPALAALARGGYVGREDAASMAAAYRFLRTVEHLLQLRQLRRTHTLPEDPAALRRLGRALRRARTRSGAAAPAPPSRADPAAELMAQWRQHAREARRLHEKLFYRPLLDAVARLPADAVRLTREDARARLDALGYADPAGALRHIEALTSGVSRRAAIQRTLLPVMLEWFADAAQPDAGLLAFRQVSDALGDSPWYLRLLRDDTNVARRMARLLASSRYATDLLMRAPETVALLGSDEQLAPRPATALHAEATAVVSRHTSADEAAQAVRALRRRELLRTAAADLLGVTTVEETEEALTVITAVTIGGALEAAISQFERESGPMPTRICVVGMGRFGGRETGYGSDADVMFVHDPLPGAGGPGRVAGRAHGRRGGAPAARPARTRPSAGRRPGAPARGPPGAAGAHAGVLPRLLRALVAGLGGAGAAARGPGGRRPGAGGAVQRPGGRVPLPGRRDQRHGGPGHQAPEGAHGSGADAARHRSGHAPEAGPGRALRRGVGRPASPADPCARSARAAHHAHPDRAAGGRGGGPDRRGMTRPRWPRRGGWRPGYAMPWCCCAGGPRTCSPPSRPSGRPWPGSSATPRTPARTWSRTTGAPRAGPAP